MARDELDDRLLQAAETDPRTVERVVSEALASGEARSVGWRLAGGIGLVACAAMAVAVGVRWLTMGDAVPPAGVFHADAVPAFQPPDVPSGSPAMPAGPAGVFRATADTAPAPSRVIRLTVDDGTVWILSTEAHDDWPPPGARVVVGGEGAR